MPELDLKLKFPDLEPIDSIPTLGDWNGCGFRLAGSRDYDQETNSSVQTYCFSLLYIPLLALSAYRVAQLGYNRFAILGRVPLSAVAKVWNLFLVVTLLTTAGTWGWITYRNSPDQVARRQLVKAKQEFVAGKFAEAAARYEEVALGPTQRSAEALAQLQSLLDSETTPDEGRVAVAKVVVGLARQQRWLNDDATLARSIRELATRIGEKNPVAALPLCELIESLDADREAWSALRMDLLTRAVTQDPSNVELVSKLAVAYEAEDKLAECEKLLKPLAAKLGSLEGARILGQILVRQDQHDEAYSLLLPYTEERLTVLHAAEQRFNDSITAAQERILNRLRNNQASDFDYGGYSSAAEAAQEAMVVAYVSERLKDDASIRAAQEALQQAATVVPAALDLGIVLLRRAQELMDPAARKGELERAEKVFLAVNGVASDNDQYRLYLGQVYYWLGKHQEGHKLFEELLVSQGRSHQILMGVAQLLVEVGETTEARTLCEEAYQSGQTDEERHDSAGLRVTIPVDLEDRITWLDRCNQASNATRALLASSRGELAHRNGDQAEAERLLRESIDLYAQEVETDASLNNCALVCFSLFQVTGDTGALERGATMLEKAVALSPSDSRVVANAAGALLRSSLSQVLNQQLDLATLKTEGNWELCSFLYNDTESKDKLLAELRKHRGLGRAVSYYEKARLLSPKRVDLWAHLASVHVFTENVDALRALTDQAAGVEFDTAAMLQELREAQDGKHDERNKAQLTAAKGTFQPVLEAARAKNPATYAAAVHQFVQVALAGEYADLEVDYESLVSMAEEAYAAAPSSAARGTLRDVLLSRGCRTIAAEHPDFSTLVTRTKRSLPPDFQIAWALSRGDAFAQMVAENVDVQKAIALQRESHVRFPTSPSDWDWAMLRTNHPELAEKIAASVKGDELERLTLTIYRKLSPFAAPYGLRAYWHAEIAGTPEQGAQLLRDLADQGIAVPEVEP